MEQYPREVQGHPLLLAALVGSTSLHPELIEALHGAAVNACGQRRFKYLSSSYDMRILPAKRGARDSPSYRMEGVVKRSWLEKMCNTIPAVLLLCIDWTVDLSQPQEEGAQALHHLEHARRQAKERGLRLVVFLLLHPNMDQEAATAGFQQEVLIVAKRSELASKAPQLERRVYQEAMAFYADEEKRLKKQWTPKVPNPALQAAMQVRANFKVAFLNEFRKDARGALTAYIKAYEQLLKESDLIDVVERMDLCNHITVRMYQRYFSSHDVLAAVHHCRIHVSSLRRGCPETVEQIWRKWHWLSLNHQIFGDLLDTVSQKAPLLIDSKDMWQFPGFHFQAAAVYARRLREWAVRCVEPGHLPELCDAGGELLSSAFLGQVSKLELPGEVQSPHYEATLRMAYAQAEKSQQHAERSLKLLIRAQAAAKERGYANWSRQAQVRVAEAYLCDHGSSHQEAARDLFGRFSDSWPPLRRFLLERGLLCDCLQLGLKPPAACWASRPAPVMLEPPARNESRELRESLARRAFEYLSLQEVPARHDLRQGQEIVELVKLAVEALPAESVEVPLAAGHLVENHLTFAPAMPVDLEFGKAVAMGHGAESVPGVSTWHADTPLTMKVPADVKTVRLTWAAAPAIVFIGACRRDGMHVAKLPGSAADVPKTARRPAVRPEVVFPVDPSQALTHEPFIFHLTLQAGPESNAILELAAGLVADEGEESGCFLLSSSSELLPLSSPVVIGEIGAAVSSKPQILHFKPGELPGVHTLAWPIVVQSSKEGKMGVRLKLDVKIGSETTRITCPSFSITFQPAMQLQVSEERMAAAITSQKPAAFSLKCLASVEVGGVEVWQGSRCVKCLGATGVMAKGSTHAFLLPPFDGDEPTLSVRFRRHKATEAFGLPGLPEASVQWPLPSPAPSELRLELEMTSTGLVGSALVVRLRLRNAKRSEHEELRVRILTEAEAADRYLLSGPVCYQAAVPLGAEVNEVIQSFSLIPLKAGWLSLPRVHVHWAGQDATSSPCSVLVLPAAKPALWRTTV